MNISNRLARLLSVKYAWSLPFFKILIESPYDKLELLRHMPKQVQNDLIEIMNNVTLGKAPIHPQLKKRLHRHSKPLIQLTRIKGRPNRREFVYKQSGGFIGALVPVLASLVGGIIGNVL